MTDEPLPDVSGDWFAAMRRGDWEGAWRATDRIELPRRARQHLTGFERQPGQLRWDGTPPAGRCVLVRCEHGLGDTLQFMRFLPLLQARHVSFMVQPMLVPLLRDAAGLGDVRNYWTDDPLPAHEVDLEIMELPYALRMTLAKLPEPYPRLREQLPHSVGFACGLTATLRGGEAANEGPLRVGMLWSASDWDRSRTVPLETLAPLFAVDGVQFYSLQQGEAANDPLLGRLGIETLSPRTADIPTAAAAMCAMDLVICVDGMPAHLAATLGRPTWTLLKHDADWRWMDEREDTPWYPTMRLFRQPHPNDWEGVVQQVAASLRAVARNHARRQALSEAVPAR